ncbi:MAG: hypothetical protein R3E64_09480 [Halioglobus sp.]
MNWEAISAIGEAIGALAVIITLAYLASQVRYARATANDTNRLTRVSGVRDVMLASATNDNLRNSITVGYGIEHYYEGFAQAFEISAEDAGRLDYINLYYFWLHWGQFASSNSEKDTRELKRQITSFYRIPQVRYSWENSPWARPQLDHAFVEFVDGILSESPVAQGDS